jgi:FHA domain
LTEQPLDPLAPHTLSPRELKELRAAERGDAPFLVFRDGEGTLRLLGLDGSRERTTLGRRADVDLSIGWDPLVSGLHAELQCVAGEWLILDDGLSTNGTFVGERRVLTRQRLRDGDRIRVGGTVLAFSEASVGGRQATTGVGVISPVPSLSDSQRRVLIALCRPYRTGASFAVPATNQQIAEEVCLSVDAVKMHLRSLFAAFGLADLPQNRKRAALVERALGLGVLTARDLA